MRWIKLSSTRTPWCHKLNEDVLRLVIAQVDSLRGLSNLCKVSRQFYWLAVAQLYRIIDLNLSSPSHRRLLHRLASPKVGFSKHIRALTVDGIEQGHLQPVFDLSLVLTKLVNLEELSFTGSVRFPQCLLSTVSDRHNGTELDLQAAVLFPGMPQPLHTSLAGLTCRRLTHLHFSLDTADQIHDGFKKDIVQMLLQTPYLRSLMIWIEVITDRHFPDLLLELGYEGLPKLEELWLITGQDMELLSPRELADWGTVGGWDNLHTLMLERPRDLLAFIGKVPRLRSLIFYPRRDADIDEIESFLKVTDCDAPFGQEINIITQVPQYYLSHLPVGLSNVVPWFLLQHAQNITTLVTNQLRVDGGTPGYICTITKDDIVQLRSLCPKLEELWVDVVYHPDSLAATNNQLANLARIEKLKKLNISLHVKHSRFWKTRLGRWDYYLMFNNIIEQRKYYHLQCEAPFAVEFKMVRDWDETKGHEHVPDYEFWISDSGKTMFKTRTPVFPKPSWGECKENVRRDYYKARDAVYRAIRGEVAA
jgi:hypothetical protein